MAQQIVYMRVVVEELLAKFKEAIKEAADWHDDIFKNSVFELMARECVEIEQQRDPASAGVRSIRVIEYNVPAKERHVRHIIREMAFYTGDVGNWQPLFYLAEATSGEYMECARLSLAAGGPPVPVSVGSVGHQEASERGVRLAEEWARDLIKKGWTIQAHLVRPATSANQPTAANTASASVVTPPTPPSNVPAATRPLSAPSPEEEPGAKKGPIASALTTTPRPGATVVAVHPGTGNNGNGGGGSLTYYNKIALDGMRCELEGYAVAEDGPGAGAGAGGAISAAYRPATLWYLSLVGDRVAVEAIWAGLVNSPPRPVMLYYDREGLAPLDYREGDPIAGPLTVYLAPAQRANGWQRLKERLDESNAVQLVMLPGAACEEAPDYRRSGRGSGGAARPLQPAAEINEFVLLLDEPGVAPDDPRLRLLYLRRLNLLSSLPLHPGWADWLWEVTGSLRERLDCGGRATAYLCKRPKDEELAEELSQALAAGDLGWSEPSRL